MSIKHPGPTIILGATSLKTKSYDSRDSTADMIHPHRDLPEEYMLFLDLESYAMYCSISFNTTRISVGGSLSFPFVSLQSLSDVVENFY